MPARNLWCTYGAHRNRLQIKLTCFDGGVQLPQAGSDLSVHLALPGWLFREGVPVSSECLTDLHKVYVPKTCVLHDWHACRVNGHTGTLRHTMERQSTQYVSHATSGTKAFLLIDQSAWALHCHQASKHHAQLSGGLIHQITKTAMVNNESMGQQVD